MLLHSPYKYQDIILDIQQFDSSAHIHNWLLYDRCGAHNFTDLRGIGTRRLSNNTKKVYKNL